MLRPDERADPPAELVVDSAVSAGIGLPALTADEIELGPVLAVPLRFRAGARRAGRRAARRPPRPTAADLDMAAGLDSYGEVHRLLDAKGLPPVTGGYVLIEGVRAALALYRGSPQARRVLRRSNTFTSAKPAVVAAKPPTGLTAILPSRGANVTLADTRGRSSG